MVRIAPEPRGMLRGIVGRKKMSKAVRIGRRAGLLCGAVAGIGVGSSSAGAAVYWTGGSAGTNGTWTTTANWSPTDMTYTAAGPAPSTGSIVVIDSTSTPGAQIGGTAGKMGLGGTFSLDTLTFGNAAITPPNTTSYLPASLLVDNSISTTATTVYSLTLTGDGISSDDLLDVNSTVTNNTVDVRGFLNTNATTGDFTALTIAINGAGNIDVADGPNASSGAAGATLRLRPAISGNAGLTKTGAGTLVLDGTTLSGVGGTVTASTYTGGLTINGGTLQINSVNGMGDKSNTTTINNGQIVFNANTSLASTRAFAINEAVSPIGVNSAYTVTIGGTVNGAGQLEKTGTGTLILGTTNGYTGGTNVSAGTMELGTNSITNGGTTTYTHGTLANGNISIASGATLTGDATGTINVNINNDTSDLITNAGTIDINELNLNLNFTGTQTQSSYTFETGGFTGGAFAGVTGLPSNDSINYDTIDGTISVVAAVPEPTGIVMLGAPMLSLLRRRNRRTLPI
jgi:fibronectin-binding autotransporter adhesin